MSRHGKEHPGIYTEIARCRSAAGCEADRRLWRRGRSRGTERSILAGMGEAQERSAPSGIIPGVMMSRPGPEAIFEIAEPAARLLGFIVIDSTRLGPAFGGVRIRAYAEERDALLDAIG